ncbi:TetR/AcrR family transcriptional regulator [Streptosporangiaceae bacterium NEAU-GS5]|nr:TetR/AcrR family transcriptional regulator [Streptosporangiaceae bacterium NEAU-GS5]
MWYMKARQRLLDATVDYVAAHGIGDLSLRQLAAALGTSHRMLVYHFGSKEGLLVEVVRAVESRQKQALTEFEPGPLLGDQARQMWRRLADPSMWPLERLFFELYGQALQGRTHTTQLLDGVVDDMAQPMIDMLVAQGHEPDVAAAWARLGIAVVRGLLLDLLATGDREGVDAAMELFIGTFEKLA